jgi:hypothetical protein
VTVAFFLGLILGILLISQFWTLANDVCDARQTKRLFGLIGAGSGREAPWARVTALVVGEWAPTTCCSWRGGLTIAIVMAMAATPSATADFGDQEQGVGGGEAIGLLRESGTCTYCAGGGVCSSRCVDRAAAEHGSRSQPWRRRRTACGVRRRSTRMSLAGFVVQVALTSVIRSLRLTFALLLLPVSFAARRRSC